MGNRIGLSVIKGLKGGDQLVGDPIVFDFSRCRVFCHVGNTDGHGLSGRAAVTVAHLNIDVVVVVVVRRSWRLKIR